MGDLSAYKEETDELKTWLADGPKSDSDFDEYFSSQTMLMRPARAMSFAPDTPFLGSLDQGLGPYTWAGRLDLLQKMVSNGNVVCTAKRGAILYHLVNK